MAESIIYALDFDGVICDSAVETGLTGWKAGSKIWQDMIGSAPAALIDQFRQVRPVIETGYEAILAMRLLHQGDTVDDIYSQFASKAALLMTSAGVSVDDLKQLFGATRDQWIAADLADWIAMNPLYPGVAEKLIELSRNAHHQPWFIVTTKQERFVQQILAANAINIEESAIFGLDRNMNKMAVLAALQNKHPEHTIYFIEDRLPTLINAAKTPQLDRVKLVFAMWGYNTDEDKRAALAHPFTLQELNNFLE